MYAVIDLKWHQYIVKEWDTIVVDNVSVEAWKDFEVDTILMTFDEEWKNVNVWSPFVKWNISIKVVENKKWDKIDVLKFRRKTRYERNYGFRPHLSVLQIQKIKI